MQKKTPWVLIDISCLAYRAWYTMGGLSFEDAPTGVLFGILDQIRRVCMDPRVQSNRVVAFFDSRHSVRRDSFAEYKRGRIKKERTEEERAAFLAMKRQVGELRTTIFPEMGIQCLMQKGLEADDLIARAKQWCLSRNQKGVMVTTDQDLWQCVGHHVSLFNPGKDLLITPEWLIENYGIWSFDWGVVKALAGCHSDNVPGIPGVGEKTAIRYLLKQLPDTSVRYKAINSKEGHEIFDRNQELVCLPHRASKPVRLKRPDYKPEVFFEFCRDRGFSSFVDGARRKEWDRFFAGKMGVRPEKLRRRGES